MKTHGASPEKIMFDALDRNASGKLETAELTAPRISKTLPAQFENVDVAGFAKAVSRLDLSLDELEAIAKHVSAVREEARSVDPKPGERVKNFIVGLAWLFSEIPAVALAPITGVVALGMHAAKDTNAGYIAAAPYLIWKNAEAAFEKAFVPNRAEERLEEIRNVTVNALIEAKLRP